MFRSVATLVAGLLAVLALPASADAGFVVVPNGLAAADGNISNTLPFESRNSGDVRYQQVYAASQFSAVAAGESITQIRFRPDAGVGLPFDVTIRGVEVRLSTTARAPDGLSATFADNVGLDDTRVYSGSLSLSSSDTPGPGNTRAFDVVIDLRTPFAYDPARGNLLLDYTGVFLATNIIRLDAEFTPGDSVSRLFTNVPGLPPTGQQDTLGLVTQFNFEPSTVAAVPEPASLALGGVGAAGLVGFARRRSRSAA